MPEVEIILITKGGEELKTTLKTIQDNISKARRELDEFYKTQKKGFSDPKEMEEWNKKFKELNTTIADGEDILKQYNKQAEETTDTQQDQTKQTDDLVGKFGKLAAQYLSITLILNKLKTAFLETTQGMSLMNQAMAAMNQIIHNIVSGVGQWNHGVNEAIIIAKRMSEIRVKDNIQMLKAKTLMREYNMLYTEGIESTKASKDKIEKLTQAKGKYLQAIDLEIEGQKELLLLAREQWGLQPDNLKAMQDTYAIAGKIRDLLGQKESGTRRISAAIISAEKEMRDKLFKDYFDYLEKRNRIIDATQELIDRFLEAEVDAMTGVEALRGRRDMEFKKLREWKDDLIFVLGELTPEQYAMIDKMAGFIQRRFLASISETPRASIKEVTQSMKNWMDVLLPEMKKIPTELRKYQGTLPEEQQTFKDWFWGIFSIDPDSEEGQQMISQLKETGDIIIQTIQDIYDRRVEDAQRTRDILDQKITETQNAIELESQLMEEGYANNLTAQKIYLLRLQKQRDDALKQEEEAINRQRKMEALIQSANLMTASAEIIKNAFKLNPLLGIVVAGASIAAMIAIWKNAKALSLSTTKLAEGGTGTDTGIITGKSHKAGGEGFLSHVEVERGERWGVLSRKASDRFGKSFDQIVTSFNKGEMPTFGTPTYSNNVVVNNDGSNSRLDKVITEQRKLNKQFGGQQLQIVGNKKVITKGNKTRIIG